MKKVVLVMLLALALTLSFAFAGCGGSVDNAVNSDGGIIQTETGEDNGSTEDSGTSVRVPVTPITNGGNINRN